MGATMRVEPFESPPRTVQRQEAAKPDSAQLPETKPNDPALGYISPVIHVDSESGVAILQYRDNSTGDVTNQIPSETVVRRYREGEVVAHQGQQTAPAPEATSQTSTGTQTSAAPTSVSSTGGEGGGSTDSGSTGGGSANS